MSVTSEFFSSLNSIKEQSPLITKKIDGVLLHARAREMEGQKRTHIVFSVLMSFVFAIVVGLMSFIIYPFTNTLKFIFCIIAAAIGFFLADEIMFSTAQALIYAYLFAYALCEIKHMMNCLRESTFDAADVLLFGTVTKLFAKAMVNGKADACELMLSDNKKWYSPTPIAYHFYISRHPLHRSPSIAAIEERFLDCLTSAVVRQNWVIE